MGRPVAPRTPPLLSVERLRDAANALAWRVRAELTLRMRSRPWWEPAALEHAFAAQWSGKPWRCACRVCELARSGGWTPTERTWRPPRRVRLAMLFDRGGDALRMSWPCDVDAFWATFLGRRKPPIALRGGWSIAALASDRVNRAVLVSVRSEEGVEFRVVVEPKSAFKSLATTAWLSLSAADVPSGVAPHRVVRPLVEEVAEMLRACEGAVDEGRLDAIFGRPDARSMPFRGVEIRINRECNERCIFCNTPEDADRIVDDPAEVFAHIDREFVRGYRRITFTGRETTLDPNLAAYITRARKRGYADIEVQTNATTFARRSYLDGLVTAGLTAVHISLHTFDPRTFEALVGPARLLAKTLVGIDHVAATRRLRCNLLCVITAHNLHELPAFIDAVGARWGKKIAFVLLSPMAPMGDGAKHLDAMPPPGALAPTLAEVFTRARAHGLEVRIPQRCGLPLCLTPPAFYERNEEFTALGGAAPEHDKAKVAQCSGCRFDSQCGGVWKAYLDAGWADAIVPVPAAALRGDAR